MFFQLTLARFRHALEAAFLSGFLEAGLHGKTPVGLKEIEMLAKRYAAATLKKQQFVDDDDVETPSTARKGDDN